jgi:hypothetical protein
VKHAVELVAYFKADGRFRESKGYLQNVNTTSAVNARHNETDDMHSILSELRESMKKNGRKDKVIGIYKYISK